MLITSDVVIFSIGLFLTLILIWGLFEAIKFMVFHLLASGDSVHNMRPVIRSRIMSTVWFLFITVLLWMSVISFVIIKHYSKGS